MGFLGDLGKGIVKGVTSAVTGGASGIISQGIGLAGNKLFGGGSGGGINQKELQEQAFGYQKELMNIQNKYNKEAAEVSQQHNKDMWDYTNYENQKKHLKEAGLNPALLYGMSGGGGVSASGGGQEGVSIPSGNPVEMGLQLKSIMNQQKLQEAQTRNLNADSNLKNAEAANKADVEKENIQADTSKKVIEADTLTKQGKVYEAQEVLYNAQTNVQKAIEKLTNTKDTLTWSEIYRTEMEAQEIIMKALNIAEDTETKKMSNRILKSTIEDQIEAYSLSNAHTIASIAKLYSGVAVDNAKVKELGASVFEKFMQGLRHGWDAETFRKEVEGQIQRWETQNEVDKKRTNIEMAKASSEIIKNLAEAFHKAIGSTGLMKAIGIF